MENMDMEKSNFAKNTNNGITLIALVISIMIQLEIVRSGQWSPVTLTIELFEVGNYGDTGIHYPASYRYDNSPYNDHIGGSFRLTLYIK